MGERRLFLLTLVSIMVAGGLSFPLKFRPDEESAELTLLSDADFLSAHLDDDLAVYGELPFSPPPPPPSADDGLLEPKSENTYA